MSLLLLPDAGTSPVSSHRALVRGLLERRPAWRSAPGDAEPVLAVATPDLSGSSARPAAWRELLRHVAAQVGEPELKSQVVPWEVLAARSQDRVGRHANQADQLLALVARHPYLSRAQLGGVLGTSPARIARVQGTLVERGWLRPLTVDEIPRSAIGLTRDEIERLGLVELTATGRREAARRLLLTGPLAERHHGLLDQPGSARRRLLRHLAHTLGTNAVFVAFTMAASHVTRQGGDDALEEWRGAAACARGRCRPDGYGCYRRGKARHGFLLEYDRGTERAREYSAKFTSYYRYRDGSGAARDYAGFPTLLVVTTSERAEARIACQAYLASQHRGGEPLPVRLTTTTCIRQHPEGVLGPIWRGPAPARLGQEPERGYWLLGGPARGLFGVGRSPAAVPRLDWPTGRQPGTSESRRRNHGRGA